MKQPSFTTLLLIILMGGLLSPLASLGSQSPTAELPLPLLFQASPAKLGRELSSVSALSTPPSITLNSEVKLGTNQVANLGRACHIRSVSAVSGHGTLYNQPITLSSESPLETSLPYEMRLIAFEKEHMKVELKNSKSRFLLECTHPRIQNWTVSDLEIQSDRMIKVHVPVAYSSLKMKAFKTESVFLNLSDLKGSTMNGVFGSGLPGTMGIQLLLGANLKAYAEETNAPLMVGRQCKLVSQAEDAIGDHYLKGSKFAFRESRMNTDQNKIELIFDNWNHSPHQVRVECKGSTSKLKQLTVADVERDLNGTIQFYKK